MDVHSLDAGKGLLPDAEERDDPFRALAEAAKLPQTSLRRAIAAHSRMDEAIAFAELARMRPQTSEEERKQTKRLASLLTQHLRNASRHAGGVQTLMHEFALSTHEGVALMCLAEALLRIPDVETVDRLIADKVGRGDWKAHVGDSSSLFVNAAAWGLMLTGRLVSIPSATSSNTLGESLSALIARCGEPVVRKSMAFAMRVLGNQFVAGRTIGEAISVTRQTAGQGYRYSFDMLGEAALTSGDAERYLSGYEEAIRAVGRIDPSRTLTERDGVSVKLSALHPRYSHAQRARVMGELLPRLKHLAMLAQKHGISLHIDAEEADRLELSLDLLEALANDAGLDGFNGLGFVVQAYQKRAPAVVDFLDEISGRSKRRLMVRLVKGAYWDTEIKRAQESGLDGFPVWTRKSHTDACYIVCANRLLAAAPRLYPQFATHNAQTVAAVLQRARYTGVEDFEFQCLYGMGEPLYDSLVGDKRPPSFPLVNCRVYAPVGEHGSLLAYLVRRLLENGANSSFIHRLQDEELPIDALIADPFDEALATGGTPNPAIALPGDLFGMQRRNSLGLDLQDDTIVNRLAHAMRHAALSQPVAAPLVAGTARPRPVQPVADPADRRRCIGFVQPASLEDVETALEAATRHAVVWSAVETIRRRTMLEAAADSIEAHRAELAAMIVLEAGRTIPNALSEIREAADFMRYYASRIAYHNGTPLGPVACISPWNFPLAIFVGQIAAALAAGNVVLAKPAEQTPCVAAAVIRLLHGAGIPPAALQLLPGDGQMVGEPLVRDARIKGVLFTGSNAVAAGIHRILAARMVQERCELPLIAETGGLNAMIVDSSALPEQVVQDALVSAFDSAGQRCSALRILCLQEEIAGPVLKMLREALRERTIGHPAELSTDIGPLIEEQACQAVQQHIEMMGSSGFAIAQQPLPARYVHGNFVAPAIVEIGSFNDVKKEVFGPVLHVLRYAQKGLPGLLDAINRSGYGLTLGIQSRIDGTVNEILARTRAGNCYVNRNMVGAVVGVQPFGGEGLSGTGPKAGGPFILQRLQNPSHRLDPLGFSGFQAPGRVEDAAGNERWQRWLIENGYSTLAERFAGYVRQGLFGAAVDLPGPTGERSTLQLIPKNGILCVATSVESLLHQICAVMATENTAWVAPDSAPFLPSGMPDCVYEYVRCLDAGQVDSAIPALALADAAIADAVRMRLAARLEQIVPVVAVSAQNLPLWRLCTERTVTINLAACGGNAALLAH